MAYQIPTTQDLVDANVSRIESEIEQTVPRTRQSFARIISIIQAMAAQGIWKYAADRLLQNLALTATGDDLKYLGSQYGVDYTTATQAVLSVRLTATDEITVTSDNYWTGNANGVRYEMDEDAVVNVPVPLAKIPTWEAIVEMTAIYSDAGTIGNLEYGDYLTVGNYVSDLNATAVVQSLTTEAIDDEDEEDYRSRLLSVMRSRGGGSNSADYRRWAEETPNVIRAYPYSGRPWYDDTDSGELITNGTFTGSITGWTDSSDGGSAAEVGDVLRLTIAP